MPRRLMPDDPSRVNTSSPRSSRGSCSWRSGSLSVGLVSGLVWSGLLFLTWQ